jgi:enterochelin esterase family protein
MDTRDVPHGAVETVTYFSKALNRFRRMHVYTPPGYDEGSGRYPIFYLLHGSGDSDDAWSTVGRAGIIMDNLIADGKAVPMVVVMPAGHTAARGGRGAAAAGALAHDEFQEDFSGDIMPYAESHYRVHGRRADFDRRFRDVGQVCLHRGVQFRSGRGFRRPWRCRRLGRTS